MGVLTIVVGIISVYVDQIMLYAFNLHNVCHTSIKLGEKKISLCKLEQHQLAVSFLSLQVCGQVTSLHEFYKSNGV